MTRSRRDFILRLAALPLGVEGASAASGVISRPRFISPSAAPRPMAGVSLSGAEYNPGSFRLNYDYVYPTPSEIDYFGKRGFKLVRMPVRSDRLLRSGVATPEFKIVNDLISYAQRYSIKVILDLHEYGYIGGLLGVDSDATKSFIQIWGVLASLLKAQPNVIFGLMNEPYQQSATAWLSAANSAIAAIRSAGGNQLILVPGSYWSGAHSWTSTDNSSVMLGVRDLANNYAFDMHQYLDPDGSGTSAAVVLGSGSGWLVDFTNWARSSRVKAFLTEFGFASNPQAMKEGDGLLAFMQRNADIWSGWTYWAAGPWTGNYMFTVEPAGGVDRPQMSVLQGYV